MAPPYKQGQQVWLWKDLEDSEDSGAMYIGESKEEVISDARNFLPDDAAIVILSGTVPRLTFDGQDEMDFLLQKAEDKIGWDIIEGEDLWHPLPGAAEALEKALNEWAERYLLANGATVDKSTEEVIRTAHRPYGLPGEAKKS